MSNDGSTTLRQLASLLGASGVGIGRSDDFQNILQCWQKLMMPCTILVNFLCPADINKWCVFYESVSLVGAFGAHALKATLAKKAGAGDNWKTAVSYQLLHAVAILSLSTIDKKSLQSPPSPSSWSGGKMMALGSAIFSGSIYLLCLDIGPKKLLGPMTPFGGLLLISGWVMVGRGKI